MAQLMDLVRELKALNARKKAGEMLSPAEEQRRKELKAYLRNTLEQSSASTSQEQSAVREGPKTNTSVKPVPAEPRSSSAPVLSSSAPKPATASPSSSAPKPLPIRGGTPKQPPEPLDDDIVRPKPSTLKAADIFGDEAEPPASPPKGVEPAPLAAPASKPYTPRKDAFMIDAGSLIEDAMKSEAVANVDPLQRRRATASRAEIEEAEERAEAALRATKKRHRVTNPDEVIEQLKQTEVVYRPPEDLFVMEQYYGSYVAEGYEIVDAVAATGLKPIDPRELELQKLDFTSTPGHGAATVTVPPGLAFIDDFPALYARKILPPPDDEIVVDSSDPNLLIPGKRKVTVHLLNGEKRQGSIRQLRRGELGFKLEPLGTGQTEELSIAQVKAVFIHMQPNQQPHNVTGRSLTVTFRDARQVQGVSDDYQPGSPVFTLVPPAGRGQFERIIINGAAVQTVS